MTDTWDKLWKEADIFSISEDSNLSWQWVRNILFRIKGEGDSLKEKAEKWNEICDGLEYGVNTPIGDILQEISLINRDNNIRQHKLEAVKTALEDKYANVGHLRETLENILEGEGLQSIGDKAQ